MRSSKASGQSPFPSLANSSLVAVWFVCLFCDVSLRTERNAGYARPCVGSSFHTVCEKARRSFLFVFRLDVAPGTIWLAEEIPLWTKERRGWSVIRVVSALCLILSLGATCVSSTAGNSRQWVSDPSEQNIYCTTNCGSREYRRQDIALQFCYSTETDTFSYEINGLLKMIENNDRLV